LARFDQNDFLKSHSTSTIFYSFLEIHNERVRDLLRRKSSTPLKVREHPQKGTYVEGNILHLCYITVTPQSSIFI